MSRTKRFNYQNGEAHESKPGNFTMVFATVAVGAALCAASASIIAICLPSMTGDEQKVFDALLSGFTLGLGAILGLLGCRSVL